MRKLLNKNIVIGIIIGIVITSIVAVSATTILYNANQIGYTPNDSSFNVNDASQALNKLYDYYKVVDDMSDSQAAYGTFNATETMQPIPVGFKPSKVFIILLNGNFVGTVSYDTAIDSTTVALGSVSTTNNNINVYGTTPANGFLEITNTGFKYKALNSDSVGLTYWYAIK